MLAQVEYLGHTISKEGLQPTNEKVLAISNVPIPKDVSLLGSLELLLKFFGHPNIYISTVRVAPEAQRVDLGRHSNKRFWRRKRCKLVGAIMTFNEECNASPYG